MEKITGWESNPEPSLATTSASTPNGGRSRYFPSWLFGSAEYAPGYGQDETRLGPNENDKESGDGDKGKLFCSHSNLPG